LEGVLRGFMVGSTSLSWARPVFITLLYHASGVPNLEDPANHVFLPHLPLQGGNILPSLAFVRAISGHCPGLEHAVRQNNNGAGLRRRRCFSS
jgi:hypothetical protein